MRESPPSHQSSAINPLLPTVAVLESSVVGCSLRGGFSACTFQAASQGPLHKPEVKPQRGGDLWFKRAVRAIPCNGLSENLL